MQGYVAESLHLVFIQDQIQPAGQRFLTPPDWAIVAVWVTRGATSYLLTPPRVGQRALRNGRHSRGGCDPPEGPRFPPRWLQWSSSSPVHVPDGSRRWGLTPRYIRPYIQGLGAAARTRRGQRVSPFAGVLTTPPTIPLPPDWPACLTTLCRALQF